MSKVFFCIFGLLFLFFILFFLWKPKEEKLPSKGFSYLSAQDYVHAKEVFEDLLKKDPHNVEALTGLGRIAALNQDPILAEQYYQKALSFEPQNFDALTFLGALRITQKRYAEAEKIYDSLNERLPNQLWIEDALRVARAAQPRDKQVSEIETNQLVEKAQEFEKKKLYVEALESYKKLSDEYPNNFDYYISLGQLYENLKRHKEATASYEKALKLYPRNQNIRLALGFSNLYDQDYVKAQEAFESLLKENPYEPSALAGIGRIKIMTGKDAEGEQYYKKALDIDSNNIKALIFFAQLYQKKKMYKEARMLYERLIEIIPDDPDVQEGLKRIQGL